MPEATAFINQLNLSSHGPLEEGKDSLRRRHSEDVPGVIPIDNELRGAPTITVAIGRRPFAAV